jgi:hypothetical protein
MVLGPGSGERCQEPEGRPVEPPVSLMQRWKHSHEEDSGDQMIFRPESFAFPPSRGRYGFELGSDGQALSLGPGPDDKGASQAGRWEWSGSGRLHLNLTDNSKQAYDVLSATDEKLVLRRLSPDAASADG